MIRFDLLFKYKCKVDVWIFKKVKNKEVFEPNFPDQAYVVDVRNHQEYASGHVEGQSIFHWNKNLIPCFKLGIKEPSFVYCRSGNRSAHAMKILRSKVLQISVDGGSLESAAMLLNKQIQLHNMKSQQVQNIQNQKK